MFGLVCMESLATTDTLGRYDAQRLGQSIKHSVAEVQAWLKYE